MLTDVKARRIKAGDRPLKVGGPTGLYLHPGKTNGTGKFILRFVSPYTKKRRDMGLGTYPEIGLARSRNLAFEARNLIEQRIDPIEHRNQVHVEASSEPGTITFSKAAYTVHADIAPGFKNLKHRDQWINTLKTYAFPEIGATNVDQLITADFAKLLKPIWLSKPETASRVRQRCERVMIWCLANNLTQANPVSAVNALLPKQKPKRDRVQHFPSLPWRYLPAYYSMLFTKLQSSVGQQALLFLILTAARSGEVRGASWDEISFDDRIWTISAQRMKAGVLHRVPLSSEAIAVLKTRKAFCNDGNFVFSSNGTKAISDMTLTSLLRRHSVPSDMPHRTATAHGFRSSFRDWASENQYSRDLAERALAHSIKNETEAAYHRTDLLEQRRGMMQDWAEFVTG